MKQTNMIDELTEVILEEIENGTLSEADKAKSRDLVRNIIYLTAQCILGEMNVCLDILDESKEASVTSTEYSKAVRIFLKRYSLDRGIADYNVDDMPSAEKPETVH